MKAVPVTNEYEPSKDFYMDVNHAFSSTICAITHGPSKAGYIVEPPDSVNSEEEFFARLFGVDKLEGKADTISLLSENDSRNGPVIKFDFPRLFTYTDPTSRVLQSRVRRCNPFFHLYEAMWFLAGRNDVASVKQFASRMSDFSDDGETFNGAYGYRWRQHFGGDQLQTIIKTLKNNPNDRRCVLQMWDCRSDLKDFTTSDKTVSYSKDVPCNTHAYVQIRNGSLDLTVMNRSNDIFWGMFGSNYVTFTFLLEYLAAMVGVPVGFYHHFTVNAHYYTNIFPAEKVSAMHDEEDQSVWVPFPQRVPLVSTPENFDEELNSFVDRPYETNGYTERFFREIALPMMNAHKAYKNGDIKYAFDVAREDIQQQDWKVACVNWLVSSEAAKKTTSYLNN